MVNPSGNSSERSCLQRTPGTGISLALEKVLQSGAQKTTADTAACLTPSDADGSTSTSNSFLPSMMRPRLRSHGCPT